MNGNSTIAIYQLQRETGIRALVGAGKGFYEVKKGVGKKKKGKK